MRTEQLLGESMTDSDGRYEIRYTSEQFSRDEKGTADLIARVFSPDALGTAAAPATPLVESGVLFNAPPVATIDLVVPELAALSTPLLQGRSVADLTAEDIAFLADETGLPAERIKLFATAAKLRQ